MPYVTAGESRLYYEDHGEGPAVLLAHGVGGNHASWFNQIPLFSRAYRTLVIDHRAFGNSEDREQIGASAYVDDLLALVDHLGLAKVFLIGQSMGGGTCAAFTVRFPDRVAGLIHADSLAGIVLEEPYARELAQLNARNASLTQQERVLGPRIRAENRELSFLYTALASFNSVTVKTLRGRIPPWTPAELAASGVPAVFVVGEHDVLCPPHLVRAVHERVPGSGFRVLPGVGHSAYFEGPEAFNAIVLDQLATWVAAGADA
jgi:pimeloyl-ACP methyl ester carboxylesterase